MRHRRPAAGPRPPVDDRQAVDGHARGDRPVARHRGRLAGIVRAVARDVDHASCSVETVVLQPGQRETDGRGNRGMARRDRRIARQRVGEGVRGLPVRQHRPVCDNACVVRAGPLEIRDGDSPVPAVLDRLDHVRMPERRDISLTLKPRLVRVDAVRNVDRQHEFQVHLLASAGRPRGKRTAQQSGRQPYHGNTAHLQPPYFGVAGPMDGSLQRRPVSAGQICGRWGPGPVFTRRGIDDCYKFCCGSATILARRSLYAAESPDSHVAGDFRTP